MIEYHANTANDFDVNPNKNMKFLSECGFKFSDIAKDDSKFFEYEQLVEEYLGNKKVVNFLCVRE